MKLARIPRAVQIIVGAYVAYLALVVLIATPLLNIFAPKIYRTQTGAELRIDQTIWINPFTLSTTVHRARSTLNAQNDASKNQAAPNNPFWSFDELTADISLASLWRGHLVLDALTLSGFDTQINQTAPDRFNFSDILDYRAQHFPPQTPAPAAAAKPSEPFAIEIAQLNIAVKHLGYRAPHSSEPLDIAVDDLRFTLSDFSTMPEQPATNTPPAVRGNRVDFAVKTLAVNFIREQHPFTTTLHELTAAMPALSTQHSSDYTIGVRDNGSGSIRVSGKVSLAQGNVSGQAQIRDINLLPVWQYLIDKLASTAHRAQLDGDIHFNVDWHNAFAYRIENSQLVLRDLQLQSRLDADTSATNAVLRVEGIAVDSAQPSVHVAHVVFEKPELHGWNRDTKVSLIDMIKFPGSDENSEPSAWRVLIDAIDIADGSVHWRANQLDNRKFVIAPLTLHAANLHWPDPAPLQFKTAATIQGEGIKNSISAAFDGAIVPGDVSGTVNGSLSGLPLFLGNRFLEKQLRATIVDGTLRAKFSATLDKAQLQRAQSDGAIDRFELDAVASNTDKRKLISWQTLEWQQLAITPSQQHIAIKQIFLTQPWAQFRINADGTNNFQQLMVQSSAAAPTEKTAATKARGKNKPVRREIVKPVSTEKSWQFAIDNIHVDRATIDFRDASLASAFRTNITELSGDISGLDSGSDKPAKVALKGTVDGYAPVALTGSVNPFAEQPALNVTLDITNLDLAALTPYSGTYAGYQIDGGRLTVQLAYTLRDGRIQGANHIIVNQMQLGKQVSGPKVMDLPLRLAIYLLTDSNGVMDLGVDVTGNVDDPDFSVGSIIWKAFRNLIVKTATSPFRALANLIGNSRDDLDRIEFQAGSDQLAAGEHEKLQSVNKALQQKPALKLTITGHVSPSHDLEALRDNTLSTQLITESGITPTDIQQQSKNWQREVEKLFKKRFPNEKADQLQAIQMNDAMRDNIELPASALQELAAQRALAVKQALVADQGLAADRAFVKPLELGSDKNPGAFATLAVE